MSPSVYYLPPKHEEHIHGVYTGHETMSLLGLGLVMALIYIVIVRDIILYVLTNRYHDIHITILLNVLFCSSHVSFALSALYKFFTRVPASHGQEFSGHSVMISSALGVYWGDNCCKNFVHSIILLMLKAKQLGFRPCHKCHIVWIPPFLTCKR